eukprot:TRINITY_DN4435_c0_g1_i18.p6 TRINITY_DN4435_c0_g1~~TRINITY_DN4435_c0_g1_i18.p6  ORF type:complete len:110 (-),score=7.44 TRINITY_DN4435_c0_g1_i18:151-480(-)
MLYNSNYYNRGNIRNKIKNTLERLNFKKRRYKEQLVPEIQGIKLRIYFEILWKGLILKKGGIRNNQSRKYKEQNQEYISKFCGKAQFQKKEVQLDEVMRLIMVAIVLYY